MALGSNPMSRDTLTPLMLELGVRDVFFNEYKLTPQTFQQFYNIRSSNKAKETSAVMADLSLFEMKIEGNPPLMDVGGFVYSKVFTHATWALGFEVTEEGVEDDLYGYFKMLGGSLGKAASYTQDVEAYDVFNDLAATVYSAGGSNYTLLSTSHYRVDGGTWSNRPSVAVDLSQESLEAALQAWTTTMLDQRGRKLDLQPAVLLVGPSDRFLAMRLLQSIQRPFSNDNDINPIKEYSNLKLVVAPHLVDDGRWFLLAPKDQTQLVWYRLVATQMRRYPEPSTGNQRMVSRYRESHGAVGPGGIYGSP